MNLYKASVTVTVVIASDDPPSERKIFDMAANEVENNGYDVELPCFTVTAPVQVTELRQLPKGWRDSIPWGDGPRNATCGEILEGRNE